MSGFFEKTKMSDVTEKLLEFSEKAGNFLNSSIESASEFLFNEQTKKTLSEFFSSLFHTLYQMSKTVFLFGSFLYTFLPILFQKKKKNSL